MDAHKAQERLDFAQGWHDGLMVFLPACFETADAAIKWLMAYAKVADDIRLRGRDTEAVAGALEASGYAANDATGLDKSAYEDKATMGRYLIGQAIDQLRSGMSPHPTMMDKLGAKYATL